MRSQSPQDSAPNCRRVNWTNRLRTSSSAANGVTLAGVSTLGGTVQNPFRPRCRPSTGCPRHHHIGCQDRRRSARAHLLYLSHPILSSNQAQYLDFMQ